MKALYQIFRANSSNELFILKSISSTLEAVALAALAVLEATSSA